MCFNLEVSVFTFIFSLVICGIIYKISIEPEKKVLALFFIFVSFM
jgi:hypothetical protein